jgi:hypothetical protein
MDVNKADLKELNGVACILPGTIKLQKIVNTQYLKGGKTLWNAAIVTATYDFQQTDTYKKYETAFGIPIDNAQKVRVLFRYDPVSNNWSAVTSDWAPVRSNNFLGNNVPSALSRD